MIRTSLVLACLVPILAACNRTEAPPASEPAPTAVATPVVEAPAPTGPADAAPAAFDMRAYAGTFTAGNERLELGADGAYALHEGGAVRDGTWTAEQGDTRIRLDPNSKAEPDRVFAMDGRDRLTALDDAGQPRADSPAWTRETATR